MCVCCVCVKERKRVKNNVSVSLKTARCKIIYSYLKCATFPETKMAQNWKKIFLFFFSTFPLALADSSSSRRATTLTERRVVVDVISNDNATPLLLKKYGSTNWQSDSESYAKFPPKTLVFPGTHDSGAYFLTSAFQPGDDALPEWVASASKYAKMVGIPIDELVARWAKTQRQTIFEQLRTGARYLDLRCGWESSSSSWRIHHALVGVDVSVALEDIASFLRTFKTEVVIVEMSHFYGDPDEDAVEQLASEALGALGEFVVPYYGEEEENFWTRPLEESVKKNQRVLIAFENFNMFNTTEKHSPFLWPWGVLENGWANTDDIATMKEYNFDIVRAFNNQTTTEEEETTSAAPLTKLSWTLTAKAKTVENSVWPPLKNHHPKTIVDLTLKYADRFVFEDFVNLVSKNLNCRFPQVFAVDAWFDDAGAGGEEQPPRREGVFWKLAKEVSARQNAPEFTKKKCMANDEDDENVKINSRWWWWWSSSTSR